MDEHIADTISQIERDDDYFHKARLIEFLRKKKDVPLTELSTYLRMKPSYICHIQRLNKLPEIIIDGYYSKMLSLSHLFVIARLKTTEDMLKVYEKALSGNFTVLQTEEAVRSILYAVETKGDKLSVEETNIAKETIESRHPHVEVKIVQTRIKSKVIVEIKGSLQNTTPYLRETLQKLTK